ncbi:MAG: N-6 DNA methylase [Planctomycetaceae bacterium]|jgi:tRNA1(Val) A37 N6-methylase TrmN6|nr:N-6 DNA methylase [Planctomycetaceae bacterium]
MKLYAYTLPTVPEKKSWLKIGETAGNVKKRIKDQTSQVNLDYKIVWEGIGLIGKRKISDHEIHAYLESKGFERDGHSEWFKCFPEDVDVALNALKEQYHKEDLRTQLTEKFYLEIRNWFYWVAKTEDESAVAQHDFTLRLIVRLMFVYFFKERGLIPEEFFNENWFKNNLKTDAPKSEYRYYNTILRNLFFDCLNTPIKQRTAPEHKEHVLDISKLKSLFNQIPFLNGGIFNEHAGDDFELLNRYFFEEPHNENLKELGGVYQVEGIIRLLNKYKFKTDLDLLDISESENVIDPEFIGKVFESLLACIDADSKENRRKITGSFYTPREIVRYMVNESLNEFLKNKNSSNNNDLLNVKILDPACGSGAFPCGIMNEIMNRIDPNKQLSQKERHKTKLEIIKNVIYGVDIQPMAVQITELRLFLSLVEEITPDHKKDNYGIEPLPNLETKFVCANTLIGLQREKQGRLEIQGIKATIEQLKLTRNQHIVANNSDEKNRLQEYDKALRNTLAVYLEESGDLQHDTAIHLVQWNPYDQTQSSNFFDPQFMFGVESFDIVIGNPPYVFARNSKSKKISATDKSYFYDHYKLSEYQINLYPLFIEAGTNLLNSNGILCYITPNNWLTLNTNKKLRQFVLEKSKIAIINFNKKVFKNADVNSAIVIFQNSKSNKNTKLKLAEWENEYTLIGKIEKGKILSHKDFVINIEAVKKSETFDLLDKIESQGVPLSDIASVKCGLGAYGNGDGIPAQTKEMIKKRVYHSKSKEGYDWFKYIEGEDVKRYFCTWNKQEYLKYGKHLREPRNDWNLFSTPRILVRQIPSPLPHCINACYTEETFLNDRNSMNIIYIKVNPKYLLGVLNSRLISYWFAHKFGKLQRGIFPQFKVNELAQFPISNISTENQKPIIKLVDQILIAKQNDSQTNTSKLEQKIDKLVYELYGLTDDEIKIVEGL